MKNDSVLVVYNTCGLSGKENSQWYIDSIESILSQTLENIRVVMSSCCNSQFTRERVVKHFGDRISYCFLDQIVPVNISTNFAVIESVKRFGRFAAYVYVDSGMNFREQNTVLAQAYDAFKTNNYGILSIQASNDNGFENWFGFSEYVSDKDFVIPVGRACNGHILIFSDKIYASFERRLWPDIFVAYCTESIFSFIAAAVGTRWAVMKNIVIEHNRSVDGATSGFDHTGPRQDPANNLLADLDIRTILANPEAWLSGFGYEEINSIFPHNPNAYNVDGSCKNPERLRLFLNNNVFLKKHVFDYDNVINSQYIMGK